uniref:Uncharacterized protein n=1 Tax=Physcomitrium patens TaxID=3218 RepID=A0A2K1IWM7_PHYPA|nr:hypothetical protein PHYPA_023500 [Physcomitrium patens]
MLCIKLIKYQIVLFEFNIEILVYIVGSCTACGSIFGISSRSSIVDLQFPLLDFYHKG